MSGSLSRSVLTFSLSRGYIVSNPLDRLAKIEKPKQVAKREPRRLSDSEVRALCAAATPRYRPIVTTLAWTGLRVSDALGLRWEDLDFEKREITVRFKLDHDGQLKPPKNKGRPADYPASASARTGTEESSARAARTRAHGAGSADLHDRNRGAPGPAQTSATKASSWPQTARDSTRPERPP
jgi:integrase